MPLARLAGVIDLHCHVLAGIDDGPRELQDSLALCRAAEAFGVTTIIATPHVSWTYENTSADIAARVAALNDALRDEGIGVEILPGAEVAILKAVELPDEELRALCLGGGEWLLAEPPFTMGGTGLSTMIGQLRARGHQLVIAHPERCPTYLRDRSALEQLVADGVLLSITAGSLVGRFGKEPRRFAQGLLRAGMVHNVASDAHSVQRRPPGMAAEMRKAGYDDLTDHLCRMVPQALIDGTPLPEQPTGANGKGLLSRLFRA
ncbi:MAG TPA: CpsB/CapC family capsule biosynthesis tyrosine phosphatase [Baekduia sp.]|nr:CpsB/CapC family capsule biosynthesis tyrosine phosphatase [Baekduia sp.]